jgi:hypothetical protein
MRIEELEDAPDWLRYAHTENADVILNLLGQVVWHGGVWHGGVWHGGVWRGGMWHGGEWHGGMWRGGEWRDGVWCGGEWHGGVWCGGTWRGGMWHGGMWHGGVWHGGMWHGGVWHGGEWHGGVWCGGEMFIDRKKVSQFRCFAGLYGYRVHAVLFEDGSRWVRMGCLWKSLEEWQTIGIRCSNVCEFPDDGSEKSEERVRAFEFAKAAVLAMKGNP